MGPTCKFEPHLIVFVSSGVYVGKEFMGTDSADQACNTLAARKPALAGRKFVAWLSSSLSNAKNRVGSSPLPYRRTDDVRTTIAKDTAGLLGGTLLAAINYDENGTKVGAPLVVWTGPNTARTGTRAP